MSDGASFSTSNRTLLTATSSTAFAVTVTCAPGSTNFGALRVTLGGERSAGAAIDTEAVALSEAPDGSVTVNVTVYRPAAA